MAHSCLSLVNTVIGSTEIEPDRRVIVNRGMLRRWDRGRKEDPTAEEVVAVTDMFAVDVFYDDGLFLELMYYV